jgi:hypothetical protein
MLPAIGLSINLHWCGKKINSISFGSTKSTQCPCGKKMAGCCKDSQVVLKITDNQKAASVLISNNNPVAVVTFDRPGNSFAYSEVGNIYISNSHSPPITNKLPVYLICSTFRI